MRNHQKHLGDRGESLAESYLKAHGYTILRRNFRHGKGEIDLICRFKDDLIVVEVKSIRSAAWGHGEERISRRKREMLIRTTYAFLGMNKALNGLGVRFDVIVIDYLQFPAQVKHYEGAFWQGMG